MHSTTAWHNMYSDQPVDQYIEKWQHLIWPNLLDDKRDYM